MRIYKFLLSNSNLQFWVCLLRIPKMPAAIQPCQLRVYSQSKGYICVKMMARHRVFVLLVCLFFSFNCYKVWQDTCEFNTNITIAQKFNPLDEVHLSPGNFIVLEIAAALLFTSVTIFCWFWRSFCWNPSTLSNRPVYFRDLCTRCGPIGTTENPYTLRTRWHTV